MKKETIYVLAFMLFLLLLSLFTLNRKEGFSSWDNVDVIYYINIVDRTDRRDQFLEEMRNIGLPSDKIVRIPAVYEKERGALGCSKSHIKTLETFIASGHNNCIIFEDDFQFSLPKEEVFKSLDDLFNKKIKYDVVMLSANVMAAEPSSHSGLLSALDVQTASGYMVSKQFAEKLRNNFIEGSLLLEQSFSGRQYNGVYAVDQYWKRLQPQSNWYIFEPKLGKQRASFSDIEDTAVDYDV
jgi:GR25 family glycosyltransferase involved in LPS biosynthesis